MAIPGMGCFIAWHNLKPGREADHDQWHTHEHMIERVAIPGFLRGLRYRSVGGAPRVCTIYQTEDVATFTSPAYLARLNNPTPWTTQVMSLFVDMNRTLCTVVATFGHGIGGHMLTIQLSPTPGDEEKLSRELSGTILSGLSQGPGLCGAHFLIADHAASQTTTQEKALRGGADVISDWVVLVEGYDKEALKAAGTELIAALPSIGATDSLSCGLYALDFTLNEEEAKKIWGAPQ